MTDHGTREKFSIDTVSRPDWQEAHQVGVETLQLEISFVLFILSDLITKENIFTLSRKKIVK